MPLLTTNYVPFRLLPTQRNLLDKVTRARLAVLGDLPRLQDMAAGFRRRFRRPALLPAFEGMTTPPVMIASKTGCPGARRAPGGARHGQPKLQWIVGERRRPAL